VNNVGNPTKESHSSWFDAPFQEWIDDYHQNTIAAVRLIHAFTPAMKARRWGRLIQVSSRNAISPHAHLPTYGAAKAALNNVTLSLSRSLLALASHLTGSCPA
jgi:3-oxoacyl-[acyl-carrier protein] reductase